MLITLGREGKMTVPLHKKSAIIVHFEGSLAITVPILAG